MATGLVWTPTGGDITFIEATRMTGSKRLILTGKLGDVMKESAQAAVSYVRSKASELGIDEEIFAKSDLHIHVPAGAVPKDGPSAGVTMATALVSLLTERSVRADVAMTGRDHAAGPGAAGGWHQAEGAGAPPGGHRHRHPAPAQRAGPGGHP